MSLLDSFDEWAHELPTLLAKSIGNYQAAMDTRDLAEAIARMRVLNDRLDTIDQYMRQGGLELPPWWHMRGELDRRWWWSVGLWKRVSGSRHIFDTLGGVPCLTLLWLKILS